MLLAFWPDRPWPTRITKGKIMDHSSDDPTLRRSLRYAPPFRQAIEAVEYIERIRFYVVTCRFLKERKRDWREAEVATLRGLLGETLRELDQYLASNPIPARPTRLGKLIGADPVEVARQLGWTAFAALQTTDLATWDTLREDAVGRLVFCDIGTDDLKSLAVEIECLARETGFGLSPTPPPNLASGDAGGPQHHAGEDIRHAMPSPPTPEQPSPEFVFARDGDGWFIRAFGEQGHFKNMRGFEHLAKLLERPGEPVPTTLLMGGVTGTMTAEDAAIQGLSGISSRQYVADYQALAELKRRIDECREEIQEAERDCNVTLKESLECDLYRMLDELKKQTRPGGALKNFATDADKLRRAVRKNLRYAYEALRNGGMPKTAEHFEVSVAAQDGHYSYTPSHNFDWTLKL